MSSIGLELRKQLFIYRYRNDNISNNRQGVFIIQKRDFDQGIKQSERRFRHIFLGDGA